VQNRQECLVTNNDEIYESNSLDSFVNLYNFFLSSAKVRTINVLNSWRANFPDKLHFFKNFFSASIKEIRQLRNCGHLTLNEILNLRETLRQYAPMDILTGAVTEPDNKSESKVISLPHNIDEMLPIVLSEIEDLSSRSKNRIIYLLRECNNSLATFYERICDPNYINTIPTIGRKSKPEIKDFFARTKEFIEQFPDEESVSIKVRSHLISSPFVLGLSDNAMQILKDKEVLLGYFPLFTAIQLYFDNRPEEEKAIIDGSLIIYKDQELPNRHKVAEIIQLTPERVRQKRNNLINKLPDYFKSYYNLGFINDNPYRYQMTHVEDNVNASEGTNFNHNFVCWVLGSTFDDLTLIGDPIKSIGGYFNLEPYLIIVPTALTHLFDFEAFIQDMDKRMLEKRMNEERVELKNLIDTHLKVRHCEEEMHDIDTTCRTILYLHFPVEVDYSHVIFPANTYKTNQVIVEEILRAAGRPMTLTEIIEEYIYQYPERNVIESSLRGSVNGNKNILPIGRTSTYALAEWNLPEMRGGTIRSFVQEYIDSTPDKIALLATIIEYVIQLRPKTNEQNILSNISLDQDKIILLYYNDGERYLGYTDRSYPENFFPLESDFRTAKANSIWYPKFLEFVKTHQRFPFLSGYAKEESDLCRFWMKQESRYIKGSLDSHARTYFEKIMLNYGKYKIDKSDYEWQVQFAHVAQKYGLPLGEKTYLTSVEPKEDTEIWLKRNLKNYLNKDKYTDSWKNEWLAPFADYLNECISKEDA
jgi:hypothetical protein